MALRTVATESSAVAAAPDAPTMACYIAAKTR